MSTLYVTTYTGDVCTAMDTQHVLVEKILDHEEEWA
jgi:hypothetical protein